MRQGDNSRAIAFMYPQGAELALADAGASMTDAKTSYRLFIDQGP